MSEAGPSPALTPPPSSVAAPPVADAVRGHWVDARAPASLKPYLRLARLDRPIGWWLLLLPCWWSAALAAIAAGRPFPDPVHLGLFLVGAVVMRGAGSTWNDVIDRDIDAQVARTRLRPIPSGQVSAKAALAFAVGLSLVGLLVLLQFNGFAVLLGVLSLAPVAVYPFMKRITSWPQAVLGLAFSWGALMGWAAAFGRLDPAPLALYVGTIAWTIGYDTIYAVQDLEDDAVIGVRSTARLSGSQAPAFVLGFYALASFGVSVALLLAGAGPVAWAGAAAFALHLARQARALRGAGPERALALFRSNRTAGLILFAGLCLDAALRAAP